MHILVAGWFSFEHMGNSAGDMIAREVVCNWIKEAEITYDVAVADPFPHERGVKWEEIDPLKYTDVLFVCGPFGNGWPLTDLLQRFAGCRLTGVNLTLMESLEKWNPFTILFERDSSRASNPDIAFYASPSKVPVVGVILIGKQDEYGDRDQHKKANDAIDRLISSNQLAVVHIDTVLENNQGKLRTPGEIEALIAKMDVVITTRLHGTVLALKNGVPVISIDSVAGGAKVSRQAKEIEWPLLFSVDNLDDKTLSDALAWCLTQEAVIKAKASAVKAVSRVGVIGQNLIDQLSILKNSKS